jgi:N-carbamoyl-L-amino-acid hydrolase
MKNRLKADLIHISAIGRPSGRCIASIEDLDPKEGITRPECSAANKRLRDYTVQQMQAAGLTVRVDRVGNIFGRKTGKQDKQKVVMIGSHLDSVINGGNLDGALGVFTGLEAIRRLRDDAFENQRPIELVAFTGEEGSAFITGTMIGSAALAGEISAEEALPIKNTQGQSLGDALHHIGYQGDYTYPVEAIGDFIELHIEQGPTLDAEGIPIGIVESINGLAWLKATIKGSANHAGTTPMNARQDALTAAADAVLFLNKRSGEMAEKTNVNVVGTTGRLTVQPNNTNIIPGQVELGQDIRAASIEHMQDLIAEMSAYLEGLAHKYAVKVEVFKPDIQQPLRLSDKIVDVIESVTIDAGIAFKRMHSGAVHDAQNMTSIARTGMIFVPSVNGISHAPLEWTHWDEIEKGAAVMTNVLKLVS